MMKGDEMQIGTVQRIPLGIFPTPLQELRNLSEQLGGPRIFMKRDDLTGLGLGGNKLRKLEYALAEALREKATTVITVGGVQSNHVRLTAAACNRLGLETILILHGEEPRTTSGNLLIDRILGVKEIHFVGGEWHPAKEEIDRIADEKAARIAERLRKEGKVPYFIPNGCRPIHGALGYSGCVLEIVSQLRERNLAADAIVTACGTSSTQTGLILGSYLYGGGEIDVLGVSVATDRTTLTKRIDRQLNEATAKLELDLTIPKKAVRVSDDYIGPGYGLPTEGMKEAILLTARTEGIILDPVYTGKAMAGLIDLIRSGHFQGEEVVVFIHTGGAPGLFADSQAGHLVDRRP